MDETVALMDTLGHSHARTYPFQVERRNRLRLLQPWLEAMVSTGNTETATHNAVGKIYVTLNKDPVEFLTNNNFYDPKVCVYDDLCTEPREGERQSQRQREEERERGKERGGGSALAAVVVCAVARSC